MTGIVAKLFAVVLQDSRPATVCARIAVRCELVFRELLEADTNHGSVCPNDNRPGKRSFQIYLRADGTVSLQPRFVDHQNDMPILVV